RVERYDDIYHPSDKIRAVGKKRRLVAGDKCGTGHQKSLFRITLHGVVCHYTEIVEVQDDDALLVEARADIHDLAPHARQQTNPVVGVDNHIIDEGTGPDPDSIPMIIPCCSMTDNGTIASQQAMSFVDVHLQMFHERAYCVEQIDAIVEVCDDAIAHFDANSG